jgi:putative hemolysin
LRGIVKFGKLDVAQVMKPRPDVVALEKSTPFNKVIDTIRNSGFSRMPVYEGTLDKIAGIIHIKDLIPYSSSPPGFRWNELIRPAFFVPETKMIDDLLREFQGKKIHLAIVVDEYGGTSGIITLEDIIEEIVGEINDEFDVEEIVYSRLDPKNFVFEGKITLTDLARILNIDPEIFLQKKKESDTLAGFILEITGRIPGKNEKLVFNKLEFIIESTDGRRIKRVKVKLP